MSLGATLLLAGLGAALLALPAVGWSLVGRPVQGAPCPHVAEGDPGRPDLRWRIRKPDHYLTADYTLDAPAGADQPRCMAFLGRFRCEAEGPALLRYASRDWIQFYEVPERARAVFWGNGPGYDCVLTARDGT